MFIHSPRKHGGMDISAVRSAIDAAILRGAPLYNAGGADACYNLYSKVAKEIVATVKDESTSELLSAGLRRAQQCRSADDKAWAMRNSFDRCSVCSAMRMGISKGAPMFNAGQQRQCLELYMMVAKDCLRIGSTPPPGLEAALMEAQSCRDDAEAAWVLRDAFDTTLSQWMGMPAPSSNDRCRGAAPLKVDVTPITFEALGDPKGGSNVSASGYSRVILSRGERVAILAGDGRTWVPISDALLDTGNEARTLIAPRVARMLGLEPLESAPPLQVRGVNGVTSMYPRVAFRLRIGDVETGTVIGAIGGDTAVLVGRDVLAPLGDLGYTVRQK
jgi:predicted aspartyl protease